MTLVRCPHIAVSMDIWTYLVIAIWDNRSVFHTATFDYNGLGDRFGNRAVGLGEYVIHLLEMLHLPQASIDGHPTR